MRSERTPPAEPGYEVVGEVPTGWQPVDYDDGFPERLRLWVRAVLVVMAVGLVAVFGIAAWLHPYESDGTPRNMATHTQLGLPPCNMVQLINRPCPSCGMTTSFSLLIHGDVRASLSANWAGTILALFWLSLIPWGIASAVRGKYLLIRSGEKLATVAVIAMLALMLGRWVYVLATWQG
jgi:hypothetical protein